MKTIVVDASAVLAVFLPDEANARAERLFARATSLELIAPQHWRIEIGNALVLAVRRKRLAQPAADMALAAISRLEVSADEETWSQAWADTLSLARRFSLTLYDAAYLELALRMNAELATLDSRLAEAARQGGVSVAL